jgi:hypothetical protein
MNLRLLHLYRQSCSRNDALDLEASPRTNPNGRAMLCRALGSNAPKAESGLDRVSAWQGLWDASWQEFVDKDWVLC